MRVIIELDNEIPDYAYRDGRQRERITKLAIEKAFKIVEEHFSVVQVNPLTPRCDTIIMDTRNTMVNTMCRSK